jgi:hypothetical protein
MPRALDLAAWLADELGGRITQTDLRTGFWFRRTHKVVARSDGVSFEAYVSAAAVWLWIQKLDLDPATKFSVNRRSIGMGCIEPLADAFARLRLPVFVPPRDRNPQQHSPSQVREACRSLEAFVAAIDLQRGEYLVATPAQVTIWNQRPGVDRLRARIHAVKARFGGRIMA